MQFHENIRLEDPDRFFNGVWARPLLESEEGGKIRYIGFTGRQGSKGPPAYAGSGTRHNQFRFDTAQMPLNILDAQFPAASLDRWFLAWSRKASACWDEAARQWRDSEGQNRTQPNACTTR